MTPPPPPPFNRDDSLDALYDGVRGRTMEFTDWREIARQLNLDKEDVDGGTIHVDVVDGALVVT
jgi:hypothetical protein